MLERVLVYLDEEHLCPHCGTKLTLCHAPPVHVGDGLGWGSEYLFICLNDDCPLFVKGWSFIEQQYGRLGSYRHMELPNSKENYTMMVASKHAFTGSIVDIETLRQQNSRFRAEQEAVAGLCDCVARKDIAPVLHLLTDNAAALEVRRQAAALLVQLNDLACIEPLRNHKFSDPALEHTVNMAIKQILASHFMRECPFCMELIKARAHLCKHCSKELE